MTDSPNPASSGCPADQAGVAPWLPDFPDLAESSVHWHQHLDQLAGQGWTLLDDLLSAADLQRFGPYCQGLPLRAAEVASGLQPGVRGDQIRWLDADQPIEAAYLQWLLALGRQLNRAMMTSVNQVEAHVACYPAGTAYHRHRDNAGSDRVHLGTTSPGQSPSSQPSTPPSGRRRLYSSVFYLNSDWQPDWGGQLCLQDQHGHWQTVVPTGNRLVLFRSDLLHEVLPATQLRWSITGWLRSEPYPL